MSLPHRAAPRRRNQREHVGRPGVARRHEALQDDQQGKRHRRRSSLMASNAPTADRAPTLTCSVGIMAYNEAANIAKAIESVIGQSLATATIREVIVVASGCTDNTVAVVSELMRHEDRIRLIVQERREGKAAAINLFLGTA